MRNENNQQKIKHLILSGGGAKGSVYSGALRVLEKYRLIEGIEGVAGTSAGAITAAFIAFGIKASYLKNVMQQDLASKLGKGNIFGLKKDTTPTKEFINTIINNTVARSINEYLGESKLETQYAAYKATQEKLQDDSNYQPDAEELLLLGDTKLQVMHEILSKIANGKEITFEDSDKLNEINPSRFKKLVVTATRLPDSETIKRRLESMKIHITCNESAKNAFIELQKKRENEQYPLTSEDKKLLSTLNVSEDEILNVMPFTEQERKIFNSMKNSIASNNTYEVSDSERRILLVLGLKIKYTSAKSEFDTLKSNIKKADYSLTYADNKLLEKLKLNREDIIAEGFSLNEAQQSILNGQTIDAASLQAIQNVDILTFKQKQAFNALKDNCQKLDYKITGKNLKFLKRTFPEKFFDSGMELEYFSAKTSPQMSVVDGTIASMVIPLYVKDKEINGKIYRDGGVKDNVPVNAFDKQNNDAVSNLETLVLTFEERGKNVKKEKNYKALHTTEKLEASTTGLRAIINKILEYFGYVSPEYKTLGAKKFTELREDYTFSVAPLNTNGIGTTDFKKIKKMGDEPDLRGGFGLESHLLNYGKIEMNSHAEEVFRISEFMFNVITGAKIDRTSSLYNDLMKFCLNDSKFQDGDVTSAVNDFNVTIGQNKSLNKSLQKCLSDPYIATNSALQYFGSQLIKDEINLRNQLNSEIQDKRAVERKTLQRFFLNVMNSAQLNHKTEFYKALIGFISKDENFNNKDVSQVCKEFIGVMNTTINERSKPTAKDKVINSLKQALSHEFKIENENLSQHDITRLVTLKVVKDEFNKPEYIQSASSKAMKR